MSITKHLGRFQKSPLKWIVTAFAAITLIAISIHIFSYYASLHVHILPDGRIIFHSHVIPEDDNNKGKANHSHSKSELIFINALGLKLNRAIVSILITIVIAYILIYILSSEKLRINRDETWFNNTCRAPPMP